MDTMNGKVSTLLLYLTPLRVMYACILIQGKLIKSDGKNLVCGGNVEVIAISYIHKISVRVLYLKIKSLNQRVMFGQV
jgi:hypothetical protein